MLGEYCAISTFTHSMAISSDRGRDYVYLVYMCGGGGGRLRRPGPGRSKSSTDPADDQELLFCYVMISRNAVYYLTALRYTPAEMSRKTYTICGKVH